MSEIISEDAVTRKIIVRYDDDYSVTAVDGTLIGLPWKNHQHVKFPATVSVSIPTDNTSYYMVTIVPKEYSGFLDKWTDKIFNSPALLKLASTSLPRGAGYAIFGFSGALVGAVLATLFTPSDISPDTKLERDLDEGVHVVYWVTTAWSDL